MPHPNHPGILHLLWRSSGGNRHGLAGFGHLLLFFDGLRAVVQTFTVAVQPVEQTHFWNEGDHIGCRNEKESKLAVGRTELQHKAGRNRCNDLRDQIDIGHGRIDARQVGRSRAFEDAWHPILLHADRSQVRPQSFDASGNNHDNKQHHLVEPFRVPLAYSERPVMCSLLQQQSERSQTAGPSLHSSPHAEALEAVPSVRLEPQAGRDQQLRHAGRQPERCRRC
mmetsp:Transcript_18123/g.68692  ORF Transcript_18123/g.68692 Transcript_18123/m.68692 type:complete len:224 (+) Transcript_18123:1197-1868(+)